MKTRKEHERYILEVRNFCKYHPELIKPNKYEIVAFDIICKSVFNDKAIIKPLDVIGIRSLSYSSAFGMIKYFINKLSIRGREYTMLSEDKQYKLIENRKNNEKSIPLGKLFGYFFDNKEE